MRTAATLALVLALAACSEEKASSGAAKAVEAPAGDATALLDAWRKAGIQLSAFAKVDGATYANGDCTGGTANGVDVVVCQYGNDGAATQAEAAGLAAVGTTTGAALARGPLLLTVADRRKADPAGNTINQLTKVFRGRK